MGIKQSGGTIKTTNVRYSAFLGMMYLSNPENEAAVAAAKAAVGEAEVKKGFTGKTGASAQARAMLKEKGVNPVTIEGNLTSAKVRVVEKDGRKNMYLNVCLRDGDGRYCMSTPLSNEGTQMLVRKLVNAAPGEHTEISLFASMGEPKEPGGRAYAEHGASVVQGGQQVPGISPKPIQGLVDTAIAALKDAGEDDPEILSRKRKGVATKFHLDVMEDVEKKFNDFYEAKKNAGAEAPEAADGDHADTPAPSEDDQGFDVSDLTPAAQPGQAARERATA